MEVAEKNEIVAHAKQYMHEHGMPASELGRMAKVNDTYMSHLMNGQFHTTANDKEVEIKDAYFIRIAEVIGHQVSKTYWHLVETREFKEIATQLLEAKDKCITKTLICPTGKGKTYVVNKFRAKYPRHTYVVTINNLMTLVDILNDLINQLNLPIRNNKAMKIREVIMKFRELKRNGHSPLLILDEGENMNHATMQMIKGLYDGISQDRYASIVLMGTDQLLRKMESNKRRDKDAAPQFYRRFKAGLRLVKEPQKDKSFVLFFDRMGVTDKGLRRLLCDLCDNYGELHDYLEPALREADLQGEELTEEFFRVMYNMPK